MLWKFEVFCVYKKKTKIVRNEKKELIEKKNLKDSVLNKYLFKRKILCEVIKNEINWIMALNMAPYFATGYHVHGNFFLLIILIINIVF